MKYPFTFYQQNSWSQIQFHFVELDSQQTSFAQITRWDVLDAFSSSLWSPKKAVSIADASWQESAKRVISRTISTPREGMRLSIIDVSKRSGMTGSGLIEYTLPNTCRIRALVKVTLVQFCTIGLLDAGLQDPVYLITSWSPKYCMCPLLHWVRSKIILAKSRWFTWLYCDRNDSSH